MSLITLRKSDEIMMSLVHYFVTQENYVPINVQGVKDEIWLENLDGPYRVIRITNQTIINDEQLKFDLFKMRYILKQIKKKTLSLKVNALNICLDIRDKIELNNSFYNINTIKVDNIKDVKKNGDLISIFPGLKDGLINEENGLNLIINVTNDINNKTEKENRQFAKIFSPKKIIFTYIIMAICILTFIGMLIYINTINGNNPLIYRGIRCENNLVYGLVRFGAMQTSLIKLGEIYRLITCAFLHVDTIHLLVNMYSLFIIGTQVENLLGKKRFLAIYFGSALGASLMSCVFNTSVSAGASGAIFGLMGALLYFGYHYRLYLNDALRRQIIPIIVLNLALGFLTTGIDNAAHLGGLISGYLITMAIGIEGKKNKKDQINGSIVYILLIAFLIYTTLCLK